MTTTEYHSACRQRCKKVSTSASRFFFTTILCVSALTASPAFASGKETAQNSPQSDAISPMDEMVSTLAGSSHVPTQMDRLVSSLLRTPPNTQSSPALSVSPSRDLLARRISEKYRIDPGKASGIVEVVHQESHKKGVDPILVLSIIATESSFNPRARSNVGAMGLMQAMPRYHQEKLDRLGLTATDLYNPRQNVRVGTEILSEYMELSRGNTASALQRYNGSLSDKSRRYSNKVFRAMAWLSAP